jgi:anti-sigma B factor antagonist
MRMEVADADGIVDVKLIGRLDTPGVGKIETPLTATLVPRKARATIDLSQVEFLGSLGLRMFITIARALSRGNARLVLYAPQPLVQEILETATIGAIIPVRLDAAAAMEAARA